VRGVCVVGEPGLETRIEATTQFDAKQPDVLMTAVQTVSAMPAVVASPPGVGPISICLVQRGFLH
jgi:hypothetical protein